MDSVLVVDDEAGARSLMTRWVRTIGYEARAVSNAEQALSAMGAEPAGVAVCDICMPGHDGLWLAGQLRERYPETAVIMATALPELDPALASLQVGAVDYLLKPFSRDQLRRVMERALTWRRTVVDARQWRQTLNRELQVRQRDMMAAVAHAHDSMARACDAMLDMLVARDAAARGHAERVSRLAIALAHEAGIREPELSDLERAAILHDVGKIAIPEALLCKPAQLAPDERAILHECPVIGADVIKSVPSLQRAADLVLATREWYNGYGYPFGLAGSAIPLGSRVIAVADVFDVLTHTQAYRTAMAPGDALSELRMAAGRQFDPIVVERLAAIVDGMAAGIVH
ncbi:MAG: response regulator [Gemmatimonadetes bacterium]|nr:response regulator [Gemmatimonadota bacterium]